MKYISTIILLSLFMSAISQDSLIFKAYAFIKENNYKEASDVLTELVRKYPDAVDFQIELARTSFLSGNFDRAISDFEKINLKSFESSYYLAKIYAQKNDKEMCLEYLKSHLKQKHKFSRSKIRLDNDFQKFENDKEWENLWDKNWYSKSELSFSEAEILLQNGNTLDAIFLLDDLISMKKNWDEAIFLRGKAWLKMDDPKAAGQDFKRALKIDDNRAEYYFYLANSYLKNLSFKKAYSAISEAIKLDSFKPDYFRLKAEILLKLDQYTDSEKIFETYVKYYKSDDDALYQLAVAQFYLKEYIEAVNNFTKAIIENPGKSIYFESLANTYYLMNNYFQAEHNYSMALDIDPNNARVYYNRGICRLDAGKAQEACSDWYKAMEMGYSDVYDFIYENCEKNKSQNTGE